MNFSGRCSCGSVSYEAKVDPILQGNCHCEHCQRSTGSAYSATAFFPTGSVEITGETKQFTGAGESGTTTVTFCPNCGTHLFTTPKTMPGLMGVRAGTLNDPNNYKPSADIFTRSAVAWDHMDPSLPKFETYPPMGNDA